MTIPWDDEAMRQWCSAQRVGGVPQPKRSDRWQVMRAGVVNLWEFENTEFWYADGWVQLHGLNETGKSTLMALTTLIPWLANVGQTNIDTLGRSGKKFRYYVEPSGADGDRRSANASAHRGWLWVEYGRLRDGVPTFFTTLLCAGTRSAASQVDLKWCTLAGSTRVRVDCDLAPRRNVAAASEITTAGFIVHETAAAYKSYVAHHLLGGSTPSRLDMVGKMLSVTRTPKLGAQLQVSFVQDHMRQALPELDRVEIDGLAKGWDELEALRVNMATTVAAADAIARFRKQAWEPWVRAILRHRADLAASARSAFDQVTKDENQANQSLEQSLARQRDLATLTETARMRADEARAAGDALKDSARYQDAHQRMASVDQQRKELASLCERLTELTADAESAQRTQDSAQEESDQFAQAVDAITQKCDGAHQAVSVAARAIHIDIPDDEPVDIAVATQLLREHSRTIDHAESQHRQAESADRAAAQAETAAATAADQAKDAESEATKAWNAAEDERDHMSTVISSWAAEKSVTQSLADHWIESLPRTANLHQAPLLRDALRSDWYDPRKADLDQRLTSARQVCNEATSQVATLQAQITDLETTPIPIYEPPTTWARRSRPDPSIEGAPLWRLLEARQGVDDHILANIEAALAASGMLDAWVSLDGVYLAERDGDDIVILDAPPTSAPANLATVLAVGADVGPLGEVAAAALAHIGFVSAEDDRVTATGEGMSRHPADLGFWIGADGRWGRGGLGGRASSLHGLAEWIGQTARDASRRRRIAMLSEQLEIWQRKTSGAMTLVAKLEQDALALAKDLAASPDDTDLRRAITIATERSAAAERDRAKANQYQAQAADKRERADVVEAAFKTFCAEHRLPTTLDGLRTLRERVAETRERLATYRDLHRRQTDAEQAASRARTRLDNAIKATTLHRERRNAKAREAGESQARLRALEAMVHADDKTVMEELDQWRIREKEARQDHERLQEETHGAATQVGKAEQTLADITRRREEATRRRDESYSAFRQLIDRGLAEEIGLTFGADTTQDRDRVAVARREVSPRQWPTDDKERERIVRTCLHSLEEGAREADAALGSRGGRSLKLHPDEDGLPSVGIMVDSSGAALPPRPAELHLRKIHEDLGRAYDDRVRHTLSELLGSAFLEHLRDRLGDAYLMVKQINDVLKDHPTTTSDTSLRIRLAPITNSEKAVLEAVGGPSLENPEVADQVRTYLRSRVEEAKQDAEAAGETDWGDRLAARLDYRAWLDVLLERKIGDGRWGPLTPQSFAEMSAGAKAVTLMQPLVATLAALYQSMEGAPRPLWLDEAFDGLDPANRASVMALFEQFDLDCLLAGPSRLVNVSTVPVAALYQVVRAPAPEPGVELLAELWAGGHLTEVPRPETMPAGRRATGGDSSAVATGRADGLDEPPTLFGEAGSA